MKQDNKSMRHEKNKNYGGFFSFRAFYLLYLASGFLLLASVFLASCASGGNSLPSVGDNLASPSAFWVDAAANRLYVVNSNSKVLYNSTEGSFQVYNITNPLAPSLIKTAQTLSFSGEIYIDTTVIPNRAYVPNRYSANSAVTEGVLYNFNVDESSADFLTSTTSTVGRDAYSIQCCYPVATNTAWITTSLNVLQYEDLGGTMTPSSLNLATTLDNGGVITHAEVNFNALLGSQSFLSREWGGVLIVNMDQVGVPNVEPVNYFIGDIENPRGIAVRGTNLYVVGEGNINGTWTRYLMILDISTLDPLTTNTTTGYLDKEDNSLLLATIEVGATPQTVLLTTSYAFVTNQADDTVSVIDLTTQANVKTITVGDEPFALGLYSPGGVDKYVYVGNLASNQISIINVDTLTVDATYP